MRETFDKVKPHLLKHEGGYVDHPRDPGGATNMGVTQATLSNWRGYPVRKRDVRELTVDEAHQIYKNRYWDSVKGDELPAGVDYAVYDFAVNSGPSRAAMELQKVVKATVDGKIGPETLKAVEHYLPSTIVHDLCDRRLAFMQRIQNGALWKTFGKGWSRRVADVRAISMDLIDAPPTPKSKPTTKPASSGFFSALLAIIKAILSMFGKAKK